VPYAVRSTLTKGAPEQIGIVQIGSDKEKKSEEQISDI
jgi:hypothetical protein